MNKRKELSELKARLEARRKACKECDAWECGYCGVPKWDLEQRIERLERELPRSGRTA
jgi:hypothetical protein